MRGGVGTATVLLCVAVALGGCTRDDPLDTAASPTSTPVTSEVPELQPGAPGEETTPRDPSQPVGDSRAEEEDVAFMQMMVIHHRQALDMSELAEQQAEDPAVRAMSARIKAAQAPEILAMAAWLTKRNVTVPRLGEDPDEYDHSEHGHPGMEGMLTDAEMDALAAARGKDFDRLFLTGMIQHHEGAITMATSVLALGSDQQVNELATDISADQSVEIGRLRDILETL